MLFQTVISNNGPLPITGTFNAESNLPLVIVVSGSAWSNAPGQWVGVQVILDGSVIAEANVFCNEASSHRALITTFIPTTVQFGQHTIELQAINASTMCDINDFLNVYVMY